MHIQVQNGSFGYQKDQPILQNVQLDFDCCGILSILGPNGAGKTTFLRCLLGLEHWQMGKTLLDGTDIRELPAQHLWSKIGYVPQAKLPSFAYSIGDLVVLGRNQYIGPFGIPGKKDWEIVDHALQQVGILHLKHRLCTEVSGGQYQMALIARAIVAQPQLLILDEPESNLDYKNQLKVLELLQNLRVQKNIGSIINTHYPSHALEISTHALILTPKQSPIFGAAGEIITAQNLSRSYATPIRIFDPKLDNRPHYKCVIATH